MIKIRLDQALVARGMAASRSQAENYIKLGYIRINGRVATKPHQPVDADAKLKLTLKEQYVSRAALKLAGVAQKLRLDFKDKVVLDVGSSTGGFTDYALRRGAKKVIAVDVGTHQMHPALRDDQRVELHEKTDIRQFSKPATKIDIVLIDVSFISLRQVLPAVAKLVYKDSLIVAMAKPQFEAGAGQVNRGVVKNDTMRRGILKDLDVWLRPHFVVKAKADSDVAGAKGNVERFYLLKRK